MSGSVLVLRLLVWASGVLAAWAVLPRTSGLPLPAALVLALLPALVPAVLPRTWTPLAFGILLVLGWLVTTGVLAEGIDPIALFVLAIAWYAQHSLCALAAAIPMNAAVTAAVYGRWARRSAPALLAALTGVALTVLVAPTTWSVIGPWEWADSAPLPVIVLGLLLVPVLVAIPASLLRRTVDGDGS